MEHVIILQYSIGLPGNNDPCIYEKNAFYNFPKQVFEVSTNVEHCFQSNDLQILEKKKIKTPGVVLYSVKIYISPFSYYNFYM